MMPVAFERRAASATRRPLGLLYMLRGGREREGRLNSTIISVAAPCGARGNAFLA